MENIEQCIIDVIDKCAQNLDCSSNSVEIAKGIVLAHIALTAINAKSKEKATP